MPYAFKLTRNANETRVHVHPVIQVPDETTPYKIRTRKHYSESLQIFDTREAAESAHAAEIIASEFSCLDQETLHKTLRNDLDRVANFGWSVTSLCRIGKINHGTLAASSCKLRPCNPRIAARVHLIADALENVAKFARAVLPMAAEPGAALKARNGRKDLFKDSPNWIESRGKIQS